VVGKVRPPQVIDPLGQFTTNRGGLYCPVQDGLCGAESLVEEVFSMVITSSLGPAPQSPEADHAAFAYHVARHSGHGGRDSPARPLPALVRSFACRSGFSARTSPMHRGNRSGPLLKAARKPASAPRLCSPFRAGSGVAVDDGFTGQTRTAAPRRRRCAGSGSAGAPGSTAEWPAPWEAAGRSPARDTPARRGEISRRSSS